MFGGAGTLQEELVGPVATAPATAAPIDAVAAGLITVNATTGDTHQYDPYPYETITNRVEGDGPVETSTARPVSAP
jgi:hypothetical protein